MDIFVINFHGNYGNYLLQQRFSLGIDLGTSNSAAVRLITTKQILFEITQVLSPNQIGEKPTLPSALYIPPTNSLRARFRTRRVICRKDFARRSAHTVHGDREVES
jgi:molecular chaperone DnaK (HSP70)